MDARIGNHIRSNVVGYVALFVALSGTAYAVNGPLPGKNTVGSADIINAEVKRPDIADGAVRTPKLADGAVNSAKVADGSLTGADILDGGIGLADLAGDSVDSSKVVNGSLTGDDVAGGAIGTLQLQDLGVSAAKLDDGAVTGNKIALFAVTSTRISPNAVTSSKIAENAVDADALGVINDRAVSTIVNAGLTDVASACNSGEQIISGGLDGAAGISMEQSFRSGNGWTVTVRASSNGLGVGVHAYCLEA